MKRIIILAALIGLAGCGKKSEDDMKGGEAPLSNQATPNVPIEKPIESQPLSNWTYDESKDEMRNIESKFASISSDNQAQFNFPYDGGSNLTITLRKRTNEPSEIMFVVSKGQYSCDTISDNCYASVKFDDNAIESIALDAPADHSSDVLFIKSTRDTESFIKSLLRSKSVIVELPFYQEGKKQFKFSPDGLKWTLPKNSIKKKKPSIADEANEAADIAVAAAMDATAAAKEASLEIE